MCFRRRLELRGTLARLSAEYADVIKVGRTHLQDATPLTLGQEISGWAASLEKDERMIRQALDGVRELALGGTAVGTGLNALPEFGEAVAAEISAADRKNVHHRAQQIPRADQQG